ncbi:RWD domain-containing protein 1 [Actinomortierella ambigua]|uniref:RWD domain-containing protein 1 n=1 Tax=Actinomortierella ambigua TaxID=1343610 RepID=A0A9P6U5U1_9FUNG|nr:RWD domain-containing protein 1 [Actinomortierella ambigua]KAG0261832.1 RWD domain-containing protein 1 [Actinomortierella ambigua]
MTDYKEEQNNELEALESIYPDEFEEISRDPGEFRIHIVPDEQDDENTYELKLYVKYTDTYPDTLPEFSLENVEDELEPEDLETVLQKVTAAGEEAIGMGMVFSMASMAKEALTEVIVSNKERREREAEERARLEMEAEERAKAGTKVTPESFSAWKQKFDAEMSEKERIEKGLRREQDPKLSKPTGRQLFERDHSLAKSDAAFVEEGDVDVDITQFERITIQDDEDDDNNDVLRNLRSSD